jgi:hypothetical protein
MKTSPEALHRVMQCERAALPQLLLNRGPSRDMRQPHRNGYATGRFAAVGQARNSFTCW